MQIPIKIVFIVYQKRSTLRRRLYNYGQIDFEYGTEKPGFEHVSGKVNPRYQQDKGTANNRQPEPQNPTSIVLEAAKLKNDLKSENLMPGSEVNMSTGNVESNVNVNDTERLLSETNGKAGVEDEVDDTLKKNAPSPPNVAPKPKVAMGQPVPYSPPPTPEGYIVAEHY